MSYVRRFVLQATVAPLVIIAVSVAMVVWLLPVSWQWVGLVLALAAFGVWAIDRMRIHVRTGVFFGSAPRSPDSLVAALKNDPSAVPVGGGWSFYLQRQPAHRAPDDTQTDVPIIFTHAMRGELETGRWAAGTTIREVQRALIARGRTMASHPSAMSTTLGGWVFSNSHGSAGTLEQPCIGRVRVYDRITQRELDADPASLFGPHISLEAQRRYTIMDVEVKDVEDVWTERIVRKMMTECDARKWLRDPSRLRMLQVGRRGTMALVWRDAKAPEEGDGEGHERRFGAGASLKLWYEADVLSIRQSAEAREMEWFEWPVPPPSRLNAFGRLSAANNFTPTPPLAIAPVAFSYTNFELFLRPSRLTAAMLLQLCQRLECLFETVRGRCEVRYSRDGMLYLDFGCENASLDTHAICTTVKTTLGVTHAALHKGKAQVLIEPLQIL